MQEMWVQALGKDDPLEKEMATHSNILAWMISWTEHPGGLQRGVAKSHTGLINWAHVHASLFETHIYCDIITIKSVSISISHNYVCIETIKIYTVSNFQVYNIVL